MVLLPLLWSLSFAPPANWTDCRPDQPSAEALAIDRDPLGQPGHRAVKRGDEEIWLKPLTGGRWAMAMFNVGEHPTQVTAIWRELKLPAVVRVRDVWKQKDWGKVQGGFSHRIEPHRCALFLVTP